ncbi:MAG: helix-turn-helix transcriptional regulator [Ginsengibacter sp.]
MSDEFTILSTTNEEIKPIKSFEEFYNIPKLKSAQSYYTTGDYGLMHFQELKLQNLTIWFSHYQMKHASVIRSRIEQPILEGHITLKNRMAQTLGRSSNMLLENGEFNITYTPFTENKAYFHDNGEYITFDIHPTLSFLQRVAIDFPLLDIFLERINKGGTQAISLLENRSFISTDMEILVRKIIEHQTSSDTTQSYTEVLAMELMLLFLLRSRKPLNSKLRFYNRYTDEVLCIRDLLKQQADTYDFEDLYDTEVQLAEKVGLSVYQLKVAFNLAFGTGPYQMLKEFRFQKAQNFLRDTQLSILDIALKTGYQSGESFIKAYTKRFGISPSKYRKNSEPLF